MNYICTFNRSGEITELRTEAKSKEAAFEKTLPIIAKKYCILKRLAYNYFSQGHRYEIKST